MRCLRCKSTKITKFVDGFGERRIFCKNCWGSFLENIFSKFNDQKKLQEFNLEIYREVKFHN